VQLLVQVLAHEAACPDAVDVDPACPGHGVDGPAQRVDVQGGRGVLDGPGVTETDLADDVLEAVGAADVATEVTA
jgi:hypothetical protein